MTFRDLFVALVALSLVCLGGCSREAEEAEPAPEPEVAEPTPPPEPTYCEPENFREWVRALERGCAKSEFVCENLFAEGLMALGVESTPPAERARMVLWVQDGSLEDARGIHVLAERIRNKYECEGPIMRRPGRDEEASLRRLNQIIVECNRALREGKDCSELELVRP